MAKKYHVIFIDATNRCDEIMKAFGKQHITSKFCSVEDAVSNISKAKVKNDLILIWHLSSSYYNGKMLLSNKIAQACKTFHGIQFLAKYAVSDTDSYRNEAKRLGWFQSTLNPNVNLVFTWEGLKNHFKKNG